MSTIATRVWTNYHLATVHDDHPLRLLVTETRRLEAELEQMRDLAKQNGRERDDALRRLHLQDAECAHMRAERDAARAECDALREANERFGKRQAWWTRTMFESESNRECLQAERDALRALLAEAMPELLGELWQASRICSVCFGHNSHGDGCLVARIDAALRSE
jgi:CRISPR/Cas system-associated protein Cas10 (large subunit of type III CRISPR-Cas system)